MTENMVEAYAEDTTTHTSDVCDTRGCGSVPPPTNPNYRA